MSPLARRMVRVGLGVVVVVVIVVLFGAAPFLRGLAALTPGAVAAASLLGAVATAAAAYRWRVIAGALGLKLDWGGAVAGYYRSQFLNSVLIGGVVGDMHRAYRHGRLSGEPAPAARAVATERIAGQVVQAAIAVVVLGSFGLASRLQGILWIVGAIVAVVAGGIALAALTGRGRRVVRREWRSVRAVFADPRRSLVIVGCSALVVASLTATFVIACITVGVRLPVADLVALGLVALSAAAVPINAGGWGPREAAAASAFALVGLGANAGVAASTAFGALTLIAVAPGAVVLMLDRVTRPLSIRPVAEESTA